MKTLTPRKFDRRRYLGDVSVRPLPGGIAFAASALNISRGGLALFSTRFLAAGQAAELVLSGTDASVAARPIPGRVAYARAESDGNIMGFTFARPLDAEELQQFEARLRNRGDR